MPGAEIVKSIKSNQILRLSKILKKSLSILILMSMERRQECDELGANTMRLDNHTYF